MKKKVLLIAAIAAGVFTTSNVNAQDFKPAGGEKNIEVNFAPMGANPITINNLRFRYFKSSDMAFRVGFSVSSSSNTTLEMDNTQSVNGTQSEVELEDKTSTFGLSINPGVEKHFEGTDRLSPYVGAVLNFAMTSTTATDQSVQATPGNDGVTDMSKEVYEGETTDGTTTFGLNLVIGTDWYFSKSIYMGTEVGFGFSSTSNADTEQSSDYPDSETVTTPNGGSFNLGPNFNSAIRLGFLF
jgi:outer membrane protein W